MIRTGLLGPTMIIMIIPGLRVIGCYRETHKVPRITCLDLGIFTLDLEGLRVIPAPCPFLGCKVFGLVLWFIRVSELRLHASIPTILAEVTKKPCQRNPYHNFHPAIPPDP